MADSLVDRLRKRVAVNSHGQGTAFADPLSTEAANVIEMLEGALDRIACMTDIEADFDGFEARESACAALSLLRGDTK